MPATKEVISGAIESIKVKVIDIADCDDEKELPSGSVIMFPYRVSIGKGKEIYHNEHSTSSLTAKNWLGKFYERDGYMNFTRDNTILALNMIFSKQDPAFVEALKTKYKLERGLNVTGYVNEFIGKEFDAVVIETATGTKFINWTQTFIANGIDVPVGGDIEKPLTKEEKAVKDGTLPF